MRIRHRFAALPLCASLLLATTARAAGQDAAAADALFRAGRAAAEKGDWATACAKLHESQRLDPAVGTTFNIGNCEEKLGHLAAALALFREAASKMKPGDDRRAIATSRADRLDKRVARLTVRLADGAPEGTKVKLDGAELDPASLSAAVPVDPGKHAVSVSAAGHKKWRREVELGEAERRDLEARVGEASDDDASDDASDSGPTRRTAGFVVIGVAGASLLVSAITGGLTLAKKSTVDAHCPNKACDQVGFDAVSAGATLGKVNLATFIIGLVAAGGGVALVLTSGDAKSDEGKTDARWIPALSPTGAGLTFRQRF
jgi:hypothetical protein